MRIDVYNFHAWQAHMARAKSTNMLRNTSLNFC